jgi:protein regulator of cytokinesis 1
VIWDEVGEEGAERDRALLELQQERLEACRRKVDQASRRRAQLRQAIADAEAELAAICCALGEQPVRVRQVGVTGSLSLFELLFSHHPSSSSTVLWEKIVLNCYY